MGSAILSAWGGPLAVASPTSITSITSTTLSTQNSRVASAFTFYSSGSTDTITHVGYRQGTTTGTPAGSSYTIGVQSLDTSGNPDGTYLGGGSPMSAAFTPSNATDNSWVWIALANSGALTRGAAYALVVERTAATDASNCIGVGSAWARLTTRPSFPYSLTHNGTSWTKNTASNPTMGCKSGTLPYGWPFKNLYAAAAYGSTTELGMTFTVPTNFCSTYKVLGLRFTATSPGTAGTWLASLYSAPVSGSIALIDTTTAMDTDFIASAGASDRSFELYFNTATLPTLTAGTKYAVGLSTTGASSMALVYIEVQTASDFDAWPYQQATAYCARTLTSYPPSGDDTNNFTETTTRRPYIELILDDLTAPSGGGGLAANPLRGFL